LEVDTVVQTSRLDALTLVLQGPGLLDVGHGWYLISEVYSTTRHQIWLEKAHKINGGWAAGRVRMNKTNQSRDKMKRGVLTMFFGVGVQDAKLMAEHFEFHLDVGAILLREQGSQLRLDLSLLVEQVLDGRIQRGIMVGREGRG
jgi:hypothetical protein